MTRQGYRGRWGNPSAVIVFNTPRGTVPKRLVQGRDIWGEGESDVEIVLTKAEDVALEADAAARGLTVDELIKQRLLGPDAGGRDDVSIGAALCEIAGDAGITVDALIAEIDEAKPPGMSLPRALRCYVAGHFREQRGGDPGKLH